MIQRIPKCYVRENVVQIRIPFDRNITLISSDFINEGVLCHYDFNSDSQNINKYLTDDRRHLLPYSNIPLYKEMDFEWFEEIKYINYTNQLLEFNKHYISISNDFVLKDLYTVRDGDDALLMSRIIYVPNGLEEVEIKRKEMFDQYAQKVLTCVDRNGENINFKKNFKKFFNSYGGLLILDDNGEIKFRIIEIIVKGHYLFMREYDIPFNDYRIEELKGFGSKIENVMEPRIYQRFNPNIDRRDIKEAKKLVRKLNK